MTTFAVDITDNGPKLFERKNRPKRVLEACQNLIEQMQAPQSLLEFQLYVYTKALIKSMDIK